MFSTSDMIQAASNTDKKLVTDLLARSRNLGAKFEKLVTKLLPTSRAAKNPITLSIKLTENIRR